MISNLSTSAGQWFAKATTAWLIMVTTCASARADEQAKVLSQTSDYLGKMTAHIGKQGVRIESKRMNMIMVAQAPKWEVTSFRTSDRKFFQAGLPEWKKRLTFKDAKQKEEGGFQVTKGKTGTIAGMKSVQYTLRSLAALKKKKMDRFTEFWIASDIPAAPQVIEVLSAATGMPGNIGVPLKIVKHHHGKSITTLDTTSVTTGPLTTTALALPKGYQRVKDEMTFLMGEETQLDGLIDSLK